MLAGKTADEDVRFAAFEAAATPCVRLCLPAARGESSERDESARYDSSESDFGVLRGSLLRNCFSMATRKVKTVNLETLDETH